MRAAAIAAYVLPATAVWLAIGAVLNALPLSRAALIVIVGYAAFYGAAEAAGPPSGSAPGSRWQVPQSFVLGASRLRRLLVWGSILGPGFLTRNPYAGFWLLPLAVAALGSVRAGLVLAAAIGVAHGSGRALALIRDARGARDAEPLQLVLRSLRWRTVDGLAMLVIGGAAVLVCAHRF